MDGRKFQFLRAVLGEDGARALAKAAERGPELEAALLPRTIMAWLGIYGRTDYEGQIPGVENTYLQFGKAEDRYSGSIAVGDEIYSFEAASMLHLGACMAVAIGADHERVDPGLKDLDIQRLGKNIDTLAKARVAVHELNRLKKSFRGSPFAAAAFRHNKTGEVVATGSLHNWDAIRHWDRDGYTEGFVDHAGKFFGREEAASKYTQTEGENLHLISEDQVTDADGADVRAVKKAAKPSGGAEAPGPAHAPTAPLAPLAPTPPDPTQDSKGPIVALRPKLPKLPKPGAAQDQIQTGPGIKTPKPKAPSLKVTKSQAEAECPICAGVQFKGDKFQGCICFRDLAKAVKTTVVDGGYNLEFRPDWDQDSILTLIESLGKK